MSPRFRSRAAVGPSSRGPRPRRGRLLTWAFLATVVIAALALVDAPGLGILRSAGGAVLGPLERVIAPQRGQERSALAAERDRLQDQLREARAESADEQALRDLLHAPTTAGATLVPAHVVGVGRVGASGPERITIDVGSRDGVTVDLTVVAAGGLVGRVVSTAPWTSDVALLGAPDVVVGARAGSTGSLGSVSPSGAAAPGERAPGQLTLELVGEGMVATGDEVVTLGSVDGRPFVAGVTIGTVVSVDPPRGRLTPTAAVRPAVDPTTLDIVGVLKTAPRITPRPTATGGAP